MKKVRNCIYSIVFGKEMQFNKHYIKYTFFLMILHLFGHLGYYKSRCSLFL